MAIPFGTCTRARVRLPLTPARLPFQVRYWCPTRFTHTTSSAVMSKFLRTRSSYRVFDASVPFKTPRCKLNQNQKQPHLQLLKHLPHPLQTIPTAPYTPKSVRPLLGLGSRRLMEGKKIIIKKDESGGLIHSTKRSIQVPKSNTPIQQRYIHQRSNRPIDQRVTATAAPPFPSTTAAPKLLIG